MSNHSLTSQTNLESSHDFAEANKEYFNDFAGDYDQLPEALTLSRNCTREMLKAYPFEENKTVAMDFACGTGLISSELLPHVKSIIGVDISQGMVNHYNKGVQDGGIPTEKMRAVCRELEGKEGELDGAKFDVIVCASAYHHFESIDKITRCLAYLLKPGGALIVLDFGRKDYDIVREEAHRKIVPHSRGIDKADVIHAFEQAGLESVSYEHAFDTVIHDIPLSYVVVKGVKPQ
ncbi:hypothetical protein AX15_005123 [Amanita polypyramis BW_CC]|nr:hypothetical protein AX15_005123 [Amanita polypyramis BW_CC]